MTTPKDRLVEIRERGPITGRQFPQVCFSCNGYDLLAQRDEDVRWLCDHLELVRKQRDELNAENMRLTEALRKSRSFADDVDSYGRDLLNGVGPVEMGNRLRVEAQAHEVHTLQAAIGEHK